MPSDSGETKAHPYSIAFVCTANLCRSVMAHAICVPELARRGWDVEVYSAGILDLTGVAPAIPAWMICSQNGTPTLKEGATFVRDLPLASIDRFLVMEHRHAECLATEYGISSERISRLGGFDPKSEGEEIDDPINKSSADFEHCYARLRNCIVHYLDTTTEIPGTVKTANGTTSR